MNVWRYQICDTVEIDAAVERVYALASDPDLVPNYAAEIDRIDVVKKMSDHRILVKSYLKIAGLTRGFLYQYHYRSPTHYSGIQQDGWLLRGYFNLNFRTCATGTTVSHTEGILSPVPLVAWLCGFVYFQLMTRGGIREELSRLKSLVERPERSGVGQL